MPNPVGELTVQEFGREPGLSGLFASIAENGIPLFGGGNPAWSLFNLINTVLCIVTAVVLAIQAITRNVYKKSEEELEEERNLARAQGWGEEDVSEEVERKSGHLWRAFGVVTAVISLLVFIFTEDMRLPMIWLDKWSPLMLAITIVEMLFVGIMTKVRKQEKDEETELETDEV